MVTDDLVEEFSKAKGRCFWGCEIFIFFQTGCAVLNCLSCLRISCTRLFNLNTLLLHIWEVFRYSGSTSKLVLGTEVPDVEETK